ncbi:hypothetical protein CTAYLR_004556 [Chrysophaeum taylorii]|uniref:Uncharacterized protein n=1 Tax=Chrysophaeum taylorii TaxID=2483200 RepID=A0AAD7UGI7_9STRA|nr:hypothetical protein CTAYLR_004556 [Chrysophaeum taylorii]
MLRTRASVIPLDEIFTAPILESSENLSAKMSEFGYEILTTLITGIDPDPRVKASMNEIDAQRRLKLAQIHVAEATKAIHIKRAEADAEVKYLQGVGLARMRAAISDGIEQAYSEFGDDATDLLLTAQHVDALDHVAASHPPGGLFLPTGLDALTTLKDRLTIFKNSTVLATTN